MGFRAATLCSIALSALATAAQAGECLNPEACSLPCPAENSCLNDSECGGVCLPACEPSSCSCSNDDWACTDDCAGICSESSSGDFDGDGIPDNIDNCPYDFNPAQEDADGDGLGDACDPCPADPTDTCNCADIDADGVCDIDDNCPTIHNPGQEDCDGDGLGDACEACPCDADDDIENDAICAPEDNCPFVANVTQEDTDGDGLGDACDCDPTDPTAGLPSAITGLTAAGMAGGMTLFTWQADPFADRYDVLRSDAPHPSNAICWTHNDPDATDEEYVEREVPRPGECLFYQIGGVDDACGGAGPWSNESVVVTCP